MDQQHFQELTGLLPARHTLTGRDLANRTPRTLIWGYTAERYHFHAYLDEAGVIQRVVYSDADELLLHTSEDRIESNEQYAPSQRVYPEASDFEFCSRLLAAGVPLAFHRYETGRQPDETDGCKRLEDLRPRNSAPLGRVA